MTGFEPFDLRAPASVLVPRVQPLRHPLSEAERAAAAAAEKKRREELAQAYHAARADWQKNWDLANPTAAAVLELHQPEQGYSGVRCSECLVGGPEAYEAEAAPWPCNTYEAVRVPL